MSCLNKIKPKFLTDSDLIQILIDDAKSDFVLSCTNPTKQLSSTLNKLLQERRLFNCNDTPTIKAPSGFAIMQDIETKLALCQPAIMYFNSRNDMSLKVLLELQEQLTAIVDTDWERLVRQLSAWSLITEQQREIIYELVHKYESIEYDNNEAYYHNLIFKYNNIDLYAQKMTLLYRFLCTTRFIIYKTSFFKIFILIRAYIIKKYQYFKSKNKTINKKEYPKQGHYKYEISAVVKEITFKLPSGAFYPFIREQLHDNADIISIIMPRVWLDVLKGGCVYKIFDQNNIDFLSNCIIFQKICQPDRSFSYRQAKYAVDLLIIYLNINKNLQRNKRFEFFLRKIIFNIIFFLKYKSF